MDYEQILENQAILMCALSVIMSNYSERNKLAHEVKNILTTRVSEIMKSVKRKEG